MLPEYVLNNSMKCCVIWRNISFATGGSNAIITGRSQLMIFEGG